jgi:uncharacterized membrane protein YgcG
VDSDDESLISLDAQAPDDGSPTKVLLKVLRTLPESEGADMLRAMNTLASGSKRPRDDNKDTQLPKKPRVEIRLIHGMSAPVVFHQYLKDLYRHDIYIPLSLFTSPNLDFINSNASSLELTKTNTPYSTKDQVRLLNVGVILKQCYKEEDMDRGQWLEASRNYIAFLGDIEGEDSDPQIRWDSHFAYFEKSDGAEGNFPAILLADISLRKRYTTQPFVFDIDTYRHKLDQYVYAMHLEKLRSDFLGSSRLSPELPCGPPNSRVHPPPSQEGGARRGGRGGRGAGGGAGGARGGGRGGGRGGAPFQGGDGGAAATSACLICTRRGHGFAHCSHNTFENGTQVYSTAQDNDIVARSGDILCRSWNIRGARSSCTHGDARTHACGYCGAKTHHAYAWVCQQKPI